MAASRSRVGPPSFPGIALPFLVTLPSLISFLLAPPAYAALDRSGLLSTVRSGPLELRVALEDSCFLSGQGARVLICVTNVSHDRILFVPEPKTHLSQTAIRLWRMDSKGAWAVVHPSLTIMEGPFAVQDWQIPPVSPLEASGNTCRFVDLSSFGRLSPFWRMPRERPDADPTLSLWEERLDPGLYSLQVGYAAGDESKHSREPIRLESEWVHFRVRELQAGLRADSLLVEYARDVNACNTADCRSERSLRWLPRFRDTGLFLDLFLRCGMLDRQVSLDSLFAWADPRETLDTRRAVFLDLVSRLSGPSERKDPALLGRYARGDLALRVVQDRAAQQARFAVRDSIYAERKKYLLRGHPPYGTWHWDWERDPTAQDLR